MEGDPESNLTESILDSVKKLLGIMPDCTEFDSDVVMHINAAITKLGQLGVGKPNFFITGKDETYDDFLGQMVPLFQNIKIFLYYEVRLGFDPPTIGSLVETMKQRLAEVEWRIQIQMDQFLLESGGEYGSTGT